MRRLTGIAVCVALFASVLMVPSAHADDYTPIEDSSPTQSSDTDPHFTESYNWYDVTGLDRYMFGSGSFTVVVNGDNPVCSMKFRGQTLTSAPWQFTVNDSDLSGNPDIVITTCDGQVENQSVGSYPGVDVRASIVEVTGKNTTIPVRNNLSVPISVIAIVNGKERAATDLAPSSSGDLALSTKGMKSLSVRINSADGRTSVRDLVVADGWSVMHPERSLESNRSFPLCGVVLWSYDVSGAPANSRKMKRDIGLSFKRLEKVAGLSFREAGPGETPALRLGWSDMGRNGPAGVGGSGSVTFNSKHRYNWGTDKYAGFGPGRPPGRGWLIIHEVMHTMGLGHTEKRAHVMEPINYGTHKFAKGDLAGLNALYPKSACA